MKATLKLGEHFIFDLSNCNHEILMDSERAYSLFAQAMRESGLTVVDEGFYKFSPHGFTCFLLLAESHASMYVSDTPWQNGLKTPYPPGMNKYINPEIHKAAFALPEFFRKEIYE